jgi:threonine dehydratase
VLVSEEGILAAMRLILVTEHWLIEGAAAVAVAGFLQEARRLQGRTVAIIVCGRNLSPQALKQLTTSLGGG